MANSSSFLDFVYWLSQLGVVVFAAVALLSGRMVNKRQAAQLIQLETRLSEAREKQALAEKSVLDLEHLISHPRILDWKKAQAILRDGPKGKAAIVYSDGNQGAFNLAHNLYGLLSSEGWYVTPPQRGAGMLPTIGVTIEVPGAGWPTTDNQLVDLPEPANTLYKAFEASQPGIGRLGWRTNQARSASDALTIVVGPKY